MDKLLKYRTVYLNPNSVSDEAIAVGVIVCVEGELFFRGPAHPVAIRRLDQWFGKAFRCQVLDSLQCFGRLTNEVDDLSQISSPIDFFSLGGTSSFLAEAPRREFNYLLHHLSSLYSRIEVDEKVNVPLSQKVLTSRLRDEVTRLNAFAATTIFNGVELSLAKSRVIRFPIYGDKISGGVVSFRSINPAPAKLSAEACIARMIGVRRQLERELALYVLTPDDGQSEIDRAEDYFDELRLIGNEAGVNVRGASSVRSLATSILEDDGKLAVSA